MAKNLGKPLYVPDKYGSLPFVHLYICKQLVNIPCITGQFEYKINTMSITPEEVLKIANLARLQIKEDEVEQYAKDLSSIIGLVEQMNAVDTKNIVPMAHPLDATQRLREDEVREENQRDTFQAVAPAAEKGLYLVPKVIE